VDSDNFAITIGFTKGPSAFLHNTNIQSTHNTTQHHTYKAHNTTHTKHNTHNIQTTHNTTYISHTYNIHRTQHTHKIQHTQYTQHTKYASCLNQYWEHRTEKVGASGNASDLYSGSARFVS
jgi:hypothetical protein